MTTNPQWRRAAAALLSDLHARAVIADALRLAGDDRDAAVGLIVLRLRQGRPCDDALRAMIARARLVLDRGRIAD